ncbi:hypothetical protein ACFXPS_37395 [Nocardia sp. NPDC059091]|uniref:hypothetical protein n=1 Tax=unclassified Nocardia TaxID=2637762 RepID=UPI0036A58083
MRIMAKIAAVVAGAAVPSMGTAQAAPDTGPGTRTLPAGDTIEPAIDCAPTAAHPDPVVVLPGGDGSPEQTAAQWDTMVGALRGAGAGGSLADPIQHRNRGPGPVATATLTGCDSGYRSHTW